MTTHQLLLVPSIDQQSFSFRTISQIFVASVNLESILKVHIDVSSFVVSSQVLLLSIHFITFDDNEPQPDIYFKDGYSNLGGSSMPCLVTNFSNGFMTTNVLFEYTFLSTRARTVSMSVWIAATPRTGCSGIEFVM